MYSTRIINKQTRFLALLIGTIVILATWVISVNAQTRLTEQSKLFLKGFGPIRIGMTLEQASQIARIKLITRSASINSYQCSYFIPEEQPKGVSFMVSEGRIVRVDINNKNITTVKGAKIGDTEESIFSLYPGQIRVTKNLSGRGKLLKFIPRDDADRNYRIIFETGNNRVINFRSGQLPQVDYIEGCL